MTYTCTMTPASIYIKTADSSLIFGGKPPSFWLLSGKTQTQCLRVEQKWNKCKILIKHHEHVSEDEQFLWFCTSFFKMKTKHLNSFGNVAFYLNMCSFK